MAPVPADVVAAVVVDIIVWIEEHESLVEDICPVKYCKSNEYEDSHWYEPLHVISPFDVDKGKH